MNRIVRFLLTAAAVLIVAYILPGVEVGGFETAILLALLLALFNVTLKPLFILLTIPITLLTMGLFLLVINAALILLADSILPGFQVDNFWWAVLFSLLLSLTNSLLLEISGADKKRR